MEIPLPIQKESDIYSYGFDESLNRSSDVSLNPDFSNSETQNEVYNALGLAGINVKGSQQGNFFAGYQAGKSVVGYNNILIGYEAGMSLTTAEDNIFIGNKTGKNTTRENNIFIGSEAGENNTTGTGNTFIGYNSGINHTTGAGNTFLGLSSGRDISTGSTNTFIGVNSGIVNNGSGNVFLGYESGYSETGSNKLFIDDRLRASEADARSKSLIYGIFDDAVANQEFHINAGHIYLNGTEYTPVTNTISMTAGENIAIREAVYVCGGNEQTVIQNTSLTTQFNVTDSTWYVGQTFTTTAVAGRILNVILYCGQKGASVTGNVTVSVRATSGGVPTGADLASITVAASTLPATQDYFTFTFATPLTVSPSTQYALLFHHPTAAAGNYIAVYNSNGAGDPYSGGDWVLGDGASFTAYGYDMNFKITETPTAGRIYKTDADTLTGDGRYANFLGFATAAINAGSAGNIQYDGILGGFTGLTIGQYYLSGTAGAIQTTPGTNSKKVALAISTTQLLIKQT